MTAICPVCDSPHDTWAGVAVHMWRMGDDEHSEWSSQNKALAHLAREGYMNEDAPVKSDDTSGSTETDEDDASSDESSSTVMGSGQVPDSAQNRTELPCGCYSIQEHKYDPGIYACDDCGDHFKIS